MIVNKTVFNAYFRMMRKSARVYNYSKSLVHNPRRHSYWAQQYLKYAARACKLARQLPVEHRINFIRFVAYDKTKNKLAFTGTIDQARLLNEHGNPYDGPMEIKLQPEFRHLVRSGPMVID